MWFWVKLGGYHQVPELNLVGKELALRFALNLGDITLAEPFD